MNNRPVEQALATLLPTHANDLPPQLVSLAVSLVAQSRSYSTSLKPEEEIARPYACAEIACRRCVGDVLRSSVIFFFFLMLTVLGIIQTESKTETPSPTGPSSMSSTRLQETLFVFRLIADNKRVRNEAFCERFRFGSWNAFARGIRSIDS